MGDSFTIEEVIESTANELDKPNLQHTTTGNNNWTINPTTTTTNRADSLDNNNSNSLTAATTTTMIVDVDSDDFAAASDRGRWQSITTNRKSTTSRSHRKLISESTESLSTSSSSLINQSKTSSSSLSTKQPSDPLIIRETTSSRTFVSTPPPPQPPPPVTSDLPSTASSTTTTTTATATTAAAAAAATMTTTTTTATTATSPPVSRPIVRPAGALELRLNNHLKGDVFETVAGTGAASRSIAVQQEEESRVHHHRESFSTHTTSMRGASSSSSSSSSSSVVRKSSELSGSHHHQSSNHLAATTGLSSISSSSDLSASSSSRHFRTSASLVLSSPNHLNPSVIKQQQVESCQLIPNREKIETIEYSTRQHSETPFKNYETLFSSPDVRSLVKEIGTDFAELENALSTSQSSTTTSSAKCYRGGMAMPSLSMRLFGGSGGRHRALSPIRASIGGSQQQQQQQQQQRLAISDSSSQGGIRGNENNNQIHSTYEPFYSRRVTRTTIYPKKKDQVVTDGSGDDSANEDSQSQRERSSRISSSPNGSRGSFDGNGGQMTPSRPPFSTTTLNNNNNNNNNRSNEARIKELMEKAQKCGSSQSLKSPQVEVEVEVEGRNEKQRSDKTPPQSSIKQAEQRCFEARAKPSIGSTNKDLVPKEELNNEGDEDRETNKKDSLVEVANSLSHRKTMMTESIERIDQRMSDLCKKFSECNDTLEAINVLKVMIEMIEKAWSVPVCGDDFGFKLCNSLREAGGLDIILSFIQADSDVESSSAQCNFNQDNNNNLLAKWNSTVHLSADSSTNTSAAAAASADNNNNNNNNNNNFKQITAPPHSLVRQSSARAKNNSSLNPLRLNLSKLSQSTGAAESSNSSPSLINNSNNRSSSSGNNTPATTHQDHPPKQQAASAPLPSSSSIAAAAAAAARDGSDSEIILTSDLGLDSTSVESFSYVSASQATPQTSHQTESCQDLDKRKKQEQLIGSMSLPSISSPASASAATTDGEATTLQQQQDTIYATDDSTRHERDERDEGDEEDDNPSNATQDDNLNNDDDDDLVDEQNDNHDNAPVIDCETLAVTAASLNDQKASRRKEELVFLSARLLSQCLTSDNRDYIVENGLNTVIKLACNFTTMKSSHSQRLLSQRQQQQQQQQQQAEQINVPLASMGAINKQTTENIRLAHYHTQSKPASHSIAVPFNITSVSQHKPKLELTPKQQQLQLQLQATFTNSFTTKGDKQKHLLKNNNNNNNNDDDNNNNNNNNNNNSEQQQLQQQQQQYNDMYAIIGTEILQHLFKHSEDTCSKIISLGGLQAILYGCRSSNIQILRHCASALANLALYGGSDSQQTMIEQKAHVWLFPLAFNEDDNIQYYACLAIVVLVANQEIEADVLKSSTLNLVEPFVTSHEPQKFAESTTAHIHGQSATWLRKLIPLLESKREEARNLACFHFAMEAYIKKEQGQTQVFKDIGAVEPLKKVGSSPIAIASKFACQALRLIGEKEPHKLSQQVPLWTSEDVLEWVCQIGFERFRAAFLESRVDGDLLLQLDEDMLTTDIGIENGIIRRRFLRELSNLKRIADYSSVDKSGLSSLLGSTGGHDFIQYIYPMLQQGVTKENIHLLDSEQLLKECKIANTIHRMKLAHSIKDLQEKMAMAAAESECNSTDGVDQKTLDVFVSYRRANGSQLASLLKVHLQLRGFSVFIDVERLEAGKFDNNLLDSIKTAKNFILVLSPNALDRCIGDHECKDWIHKEIVAALASNCNIIPIIDNFHWPEAEQLPEDMRSITYFNGVRWIHDYQDACVDKVERFIRGEINNGGTMLSSSSAQSSLQRLPGGGGGGGGGQYSSTPSIVATPSISAFPSCSSMTRPPFDSDHHPLSFATQSVGQRRL